MTTITQQISEENLQTYFASHDVAVPTGFYDYLKSADTRHRKPTTQELEEYVSMVLTRMTQTGARRTPKENLAAFEAGWQENLKLLKEQGLSAQALKPKYFRGSKFLRYQKSLIVTDNLQLEYDLLVLARYLIFSKYLSAVSHIHELGSGSCGNLLQLAEMFPDKHLHGYDWTQASVDIAELMRTKYGVKSDGHRLDMLSPPPDLRFEPDSAVVTVHALEQLGQNHGPLIEFLLRGKPSLVVNIEPIVELYDPTNVYDQLALCYSRDRNYLSGYLAALKKHEAQGDIQILEINRPYVGGVIHEASLIAWRPI